MKGTCTFCHKNHVEVEEVSVENKPGYICEVCKKKYGFIQHNRLEPERYDDEERGK